MKWTVMLLVTLAVAGCMKNDSQEAAPSMTSAECLEIGMMLDAETGQCVEPPFEIREFEDPNHHCVVTEQRDRVHAPDLVGNPWALGQSWRYSLVVDGEDMGTTQLVYYADQDFDGAGTALHYMVGTPTREEALLHAVESINPMLGRIHRILYSPHESGDHANMFNFPLCPGSTWTTTFFGESFTLTARNATLDLPQGTDQGFRIDGDAPSGSTLALSYSPAIQWFTFIDLDRSDGGTVDMALESTAAGYNGEAFFLRGQQDESFTISQFASNVPMDREDGNDGPYDTLGLKVSGSVGPGVMRLELLDPAGAVQWTTDLMSTDGQVVNHLFEVPYAAGQWTLRSVGAVQSSSLMAYVVSIYDRSDSV